MACLKLSGKIPSESDKLIKRVIGGTSATRQDLISSVGITSSVQSQNRLSHIFMKNELTPEI